MFDKQTEDQITFVLALVGAVTGIYGALTGTIALGWDFFKWRRSEVLLYVRVQTGMIYSPGDHPLAKAIAPLKPDQRQVMIVVQNRGGKPTTLNTFGMEVYKSWLHQLFRRSPQWFVMTAPRTTQPIPYLLDVGKEWIGTFDQTPEIDGYIDQRCYILVNSSARTKHIRCLVRPKTRKV